MGHLALKGMKQGKKVSAEVMVEELQHSLKRESTFFSQFIMIIMSVESGGTFKFPGDEKYLHLSIFFSHLMG